MGQWKKKKQEWTERNCKKIAKEKQEKKKGIRSHTEIVTVRKQGNLPFYSAKAPSHLSVIHNPLSTYSFFSDIINEIKSKKFKELFFFDLSKVEEISVDAIMYILAIMRNIKSREVFKYTFKGNQPSNPDADKLLRESGFFRYVKSNHPNLNTESDNLQIITGREVDNVVAGEVCDFVNSRCNPEKKITDILYEVIIELMTNTVQHAYNDSGVLTVPHWYIYAGDLGEDVQIVFLDTGRGIPQTVYKKALEKFGEIFANNKGDSYYVISALNGEWRTKTGDNYRGRGLPCVAEYSENPMVHCLTVVSGSAVVHVDNHQMKQEELEKKIFGTLYYWKIRKSGIKEVVDVEN